MIKNTHARIGDFARVIARGQTSLLVNGGAYTVTTIDTSFGPTAISGNVIDLGYSHGFTQNQQVLYDAGYGTAISGLADGGLYYIDVVDATRVRLLDAPDGSVVAISGGTGQGHRLVPTNRAGVRDDGSPRFDPASPGTVSGTTLKLPYSLKLDSHTLGVGDAVVYSSGGGEPISGLVDGGTYYIVGVSGTSYRLSETKGGAAIALSLSEIGRASCRERV